MEDVHSHNLVEFFEKMSSWERGVVEGREISLAQMHLLEVVGNHKQIRMKELSGILGVTTGTLTVMVHRLEKKGYLKRVKDSDDKRSYFLKLTESGLEEYSNHHLMHDHLIEQITEILGKDASELFFRQLGEINESL